jgi:hypothetical protein
VQAPYTISPLAIYRAPRLDPAFQSAIHVPVCRPCDCALPRTSVL